MKKRFKCKTCNKYFDVNIESSEGIILTKKDIDFARKILNICWDCKENQDYVSYDLKTKEWSNDVVSGLTTSQGIKMEITKNNEKI